jgi:hypothetical protein
VEEFFHSSVECNEIHGTEPLVYEPSPVELRLPLKRTYVRKFINPAVLLRTRKNCNIIFEHPHKKDNTNTLVEKTKNSRSKRKQNSGTSGT